MKLLVNETKTSIESLGCHSLTSFKGLIELGIYSPFLVFQRSLFLAIHFSKRIESFCYQIHNNKSKTVNDEEYSLCSAKTHYLQKLNKILIKILK